MSQADTPDPFEPAIETLSARLPQRALESLTRGDESEFDSNVITERELTNERLLELIDESGTPRYQITRTAVDFLARKMSLQTSDDVHEQSNTAFEGGSNPFIHIVRQILQRETSQETDEEVT